MTKHMKNAEKYPNHHGIPEKTWDLRVTAWHAPLNPDFLPSPYTGTDDGAPCHSVRVPIHRHSRRQAPRGPRRSLKRCGLSEPQRPRPGAGALRFLPLRSVSPPHVRPALCEAGARQVSSLRLLKKLVHRPPEPRAAVELSAVRPHSRFLRETCLFSGRLYFSSRSAVLCKVPGMGFSLLLVRSGISRLCNSREF